MSPTLHFLGSWPAWHKKAWFLEGMPSLYRLVHLSLNYYSVRFTRHNPQKSINLDRLWIRFTCPCQIEWMHCIVYNDRVVSRPLKQAPQKQIRPRKLKPNLKEWFKKHLSRFSANLSLIQTTKALQLQQVYSWVQVYSFRLGLKPLLCISCNTYFLLSEASTSEPESLVDTISISQTHMSPDYRRCYAFTQFGRGTWILFRVGRDLLTFVDCGV